MLETVPLPFSAMEDNDEEGNDFEVLDDDDDDAEEAVDTGSVGELLR